MSPTQSEHVDDCGNKASVLRSELSCDKLPVSDRARIMLDVCASGGEDLAVLTGREAKHYWVWRGAEALSLSLLKVVWLLLLQASLITIASLPLAKVANIQ